MTPSRQNDLRAVALGMGCALQAYYGYVLCQLLSGRQELNTLGTWLGLSASLAVIQWALSSGPQAKPSCADR